MSDQSTLGGPDFGRGQSRLSGNDDNLADYLAALDLHAIVSATDARGAITHVNSRFTEISGYALEELHGQTHRVLRSGIHERSFFKQMWQTISRGRPWRGEICNRAKNGELYWVDTLIFPILGEDGRPRRYVSVRFDITRHKAALAELETARLSLEETARFSKIGGFSLEVGSDVFDLDPTARAIVSAPPERILKVQDALKLFDKDYQPAVADALRGCAQDRRAFDIIVLTSGWGDRDLHLRLMGRPVVEDGKVHHIMGVLQDVTEHYEREAAMERLNERFRAIVKHTPAAISLRDRTGTLHLANPHYETLTGRSGVKGLVEGDLFPDDLADILSARDAAASSANAPLTTEDVYDLPGGESRTLLTSRFMIDDAVIGDRLVCAIGADITGLKQLQRELEQARQAAEAATRAKDDFVSVISHELRTPMNGVLGMAEALGHTAMTQEQARMLGVIRDSGRLMMTLINDLLDLAKVQRGALTLEASPLNPAAVVDGALAAHRENAAAKCLGLDLTVADGAKVTRVGDALRLQQIVHNLVGNALKFTEKGSVHVALDTAAHGALVLSVSDTGIGMDPDQAATVFDSFAQADSSIARRFGGTGLGLSIVKGLTEAMGGAIRVESAVGIGSTFTVELPLAYPSGKVQAAAPAKAEVTHPVRGLRVLAADDNEINRAVLEAFLRKLGAEVTVVDGGRAAVAAARAQRFDVILLDVVMPDMDGPAALVTIREEAAANGLAAPPAAAVTGQANAAEIAACLSAGFSAHLAKPIDEARLVAVLSSLPR